ncbi:MAG: hypothetical protein LVQ95_04110 [Candidatus Micrarchaeales archaeon]|nr:hypothetical protein [Candidatus Micrarchaeales archaeon]
MPPLTIEVYSDEAKRWIEAVRLKPGDNPGSMSNHTPDMRREIIMFKCSADDSRSIIYKPKTSVDFTVCAKSSAASLRMVSTLGDLDIIRTLRKGDSLEMNVTTDISRGPRTVKFTHV